jgi:hypothetical protein
MNKSANARFAITSWDEQPYSEGQDQPKLTRARVTRTYTGDIDGEGQVEYLMMYAGDGSATFVGLERVVGHVAGNAGSFVLQRTGVFEGGLAKEAYVVIPGSAVRPFHAGGPSRGARRPPGRQDFPREAWPPRGEGTSAVGHGMEHPFTLTYELD